MPKCNEENYVVNVNKSVSVSVSVCTLLQWSKWRINGKCLMSVECRGSASGAYGSMLGHWNVLDTVIPIPIPRQVMLI